MTFTLGSHFFPAEWGSEALNDYSSHHLLVASKCVCVCVAASSCPFTDLPINPGFDNTGLVSRIEERALVE